MRHIVRTSENSIHSFIQTGTNTTKCGSGGLWWLYSTDSGSTWTCGANLSSDTTNLVYASATVDTTDTIYIVYSMVTSGAGTGKSVYYRKLTKGIGSSWTLEAQQTVLSNSPTVGYHYATVELEGTTRLWLATRYYDGTNFQVSVYYSDGLGTAPVWTVSQATLDVAGNSSTYHYPAIARFGSNVGIIYNDQATSGDLKWRRRNDSDGLTNWTSEVTIDANIDPTATSFTAVGDTTGNIFVAANDGAAVELSYFNGVLWSPFSTVSSAAVGDSFVSLSTDGTSVWVFYGETTGLSSSLAGSRKLVYKKCSPPFITASCDATSTPIATYHGIFNKYWSVIDNVYLDDTTDAGNTTSADTQMLTSTRGSGENDTIYFGKTEKYDAISWDVSTNGAGGVIAWEYWNGLTWSTLTFTTSANTNFQNDGWGSFTDPADWATTQINSEATPYYYIRARTTTNFSSPPVGVQFDSMLAFYYPSTVSIPNANSEINIVWTEHANTIAKVRSSQITVTTSTPNTTSTTNISSPVVGYSSTINATQPPTLRHIVRTSDDTIHSFIQMGTDVTSCGTGGLWWLYSTDSGTTWTCGGNLSSDTTNLMYASATVDTSDNVYVLYSQATTTGGITKSVNYRKLTKGVGSAWTLEAAQTALSGSVTTGYHYASMELEGTTRLWLATRYYDGTNYQVSVYYSDGLSTTPVWTLSTTYLSPAGNSSSYHHPAVVRFGLNIGVIYTDNLGVTVWRHRRDSDQLNNWTNVEIVREFFGQTTNFSAVGDSSGNVFFVTDVCCTQTVFRYFNGYQWSRESYPSDGYGSTGNEFLSISTDGVNAWIVWATKSGLSSGLPGNRKLMYRKIIPPYSPGNFDTVATPIVSYHRIFDKVWSHVSSSYTDITGAAGDTTSADTPMVTGVGDALYFGQTEKYDAISWDVSTVGVGGQVAWEYWNGTAWVRITDFLGVSNTTFTADGYLSFIPNTDWTTTTVGGESTPHYYVRARVLTAYSTAPIGVQFAAIPLIKNVNVVSAPAPDALHVIWTENSASPVRVRSSRLSVTAYNETPNTVTSSNIAPMLAYSAEYSEGHTATKSSNATKIVRTSDGTLHSFVQSGRVMACATATGNDGNGLNWIYSTDEGVTWLCGGQLASFSYVGSFSASNFYSASVTVDSNDNIYVVYSTMYYQASIYHDVFYRKLTKGVGSSWTLENAQTVLDASASTSYSYSTITMQDDTRLWLATRYFDGTNYQIAIYNSDGLSAAPSWSQSIASLDTPGTSSLRHMPVFARFGTNIGVIYRQETDDLRWRYRRDADALTSWENNAVILANMPSGQTPLAGFSAQSRSSGEIFVAVPNLNTNIDFIYFNGTTWASPVSISTSAANAFSTLTVDDSSVLLIYGDTTGLSSGLSGSRKLSYKRGTPPFTAADFAMDSTPLISYHRIFDKVWSHVSSSYTDITGAAGDTTSADTPMVTGVGDALYFGQTEKYDAISWDVSTVGVGGQVAWEYWNGTAWVRITDFLGVSNTTFTADGYLSFIPNTDWTTTTVGGESTPHYYVRARVLTAYSTAPIGVQFAAIPQINWASFTSDIVPPNNAMGIWTENEFGIARARFTSFSNYSPNTPSDLGPSNRVGGSYTSDTTPTMSFSITDDDVSDAVQYRIQIDDSSDFTSPIVDYTSPIASQGTFSYTVGDSTGTYTTGSSSTRISTDGAYYWRVKGVDDRNDIGAWTNANSGGIAFRHDKTAPTEIELVSPGDKWYIREDRPTFKWKVASDLGSGIITSYKVEIDNGDSGDFTIDEIPSSRNSDYETDKYIARYENFSDSDPSNNYISVQTKSSGLWGKDNNDGKLKEGKRNWEVSIEDHVGNLREASRTLYFDKTQPVLRFTQVNKYPLESGANTFTTSDTTPTIFAKIFDHLSGETTSLDNEIVSKNKVSSGPDRLELKFEKKNSFGQNEAYLFATISLNENYWTDTEARIEDYSLNNHGKFSPFEYTVSSALPHDIYKVTITGIDKAGNSNSSTTFDLNVTTLESMLTPEEKRLVDEETKTLRPEAKEKTLREIEITRQAAVDTPVRLDALKTLADVGEGVKKIAISPALFFKRMIEYYGNVAKSGSQIIGEGIKKPKILLAKYGQWVSYSTATFHEIVLDESPTNISNVRITEVTESSVVITWDTNHHTFNNKINYGKNRSYGNSAVSSDWQKRHETHITGLTPNTKYYFEVMSQGKNYTYDANYEFRTRKN